MEHDLSILSLFLSQQFQIQIQIHNIYCLKHDVYALKILQMKGSTNKSTEDVQICAKAAHCPPLPPPPAPSRYSATRFGESAG